MRIYLKIAEWIAGACRLLVEAAIIVIMLLTVADVILRHTARITIMGVTEYSQMLMAIILLATASTALADGHIKVDILYNRLGRTMQKICVIFTCALSMAISAITAARAFFEVDRAIRDKVTYLTLGWPQWPFYMFFGIAMAALCLAALGVIFKTLMEQEPAQEPVEKEGGKNE